jgi:hypothetical protein
VDARQRILLSTTFGDIYIDRETPPSEAPQGVRQGDELFSEVLELTEPAPEGTFLTIDATAGNVRVEATDEEVVRVQATRLVWAETAARAPEALRALRVEPQRAASQLTIQTLAGEQLSSMGVSSHKVDLVVYCPRDVPLTIRAQQGLTNVAGMAAAVNVTQAKGDVTVERCENEVDVATQEGSIQVRDSVGPVEAVCRYGTLTLSRIMGNIISDNAQGLTVVESPRGDVVVRASGGDVRILALEGVSGNFDVSVRQADLRILLPEEPNAEIQARSRDGIIYSAKPLLGTIQGPTRDFSTRMGEGLYTLKLETVEGDLTID